MKISMCKCGNRNPNVVASEQDVMWVGCCDCGRSSSIAASREHAIASWNADMALLFGGGQSERERLAKEFMVASMTAYYEQKYGVDIHAETGFRAADAFILQRDEERKKESKP